MPEPSDVVQRARQALDGSWEGEYAIGDLVRELADEVEKLRGERDELRATIDDLCEWRDQHRREGHEIEDLRNTIERVRMLHSKRPVAPGCTTDSEPWPCSTIRALDGEA